MGLDFKRLTHGIGMAALSVSVFLAIACGRSKETPDITGGAGSGGGSVAGSTGSNAGSGGTNAGGNGSGGGPGGAGGSDPLGSFGACAPGIQNGQPCSTSDQPCRILACRACAQSLWRETWLDLCVCGSPGVWNCVLLGAGQVIGDCIFELPLDCAVAGQYFSDPECTVHPTCDGGT
jgi:hypothetical protein